MHKISSRLNEKTNGFNLLRLWKRQFLSISPTSRLSFTWKRYKAWYVLSHDSSRWPGKKDRPYWSWILLNFIKNTGANLENFREKIVFKSAHKQNEQIRFVENDHCYSNLRSDIFHMTIFEEKKRVFFVSTNSLRCINFIFAFAERTDDQTLIAYVSL